MPEMTPNLYAGIMGSSVSIRVNFEVELFKRGTRERTCQVTEKRLLDVFSDPYSLLSLEKVARNYQLGISDTVLQEGGYAEYRLPQAPITVLDFLRLIHPQKGEQRTHITGCDILISSSSNQCQNDKQYNILCNEFILHDKSFDILSDEYKFAYDIALFLGCRRSQIFVSDLALRLYNVCLPPAKLIATKPDSNRSCLAVPVLTFVREPKWSSLRRTFSLSLILVPCTIAKTESKESVQGQEAISSRPFTAREMNDTLIRWGYRDSLVTQFKIDGPLARYCGLSSSDEVSVDELLHFILSQTIDLLKNSRSSNKGHVIIRVQEDLSKQKFAALIPIGFDNALDENDKNLRPLLRETVDSYNSFTGVDYPDLVDFPKLNVNEEHGLNPGRLLFYNPVGNVLVALHRESTEEASGHSVIRAFSWYLYTIQAASSLKSMIHSFYAAIQERSTLRPIIDVERQLIEDLDEFYDLDIQYQNYKIVYEKLKKLAGLDEDYIRLKDKLTSLKSDLDLEEGKHISALLVLLSVAVIFETFYIFQPSLFALLLSFIIPPVLGAIVWLGAPEKMINKLRRWV